MNEQQLLLTPAVPTRPQSVTISLIGVPPVYIKYSLLHLSNFILTTLLLEPAGVRSSGGSGLIFMQ